MIKSLLLCVLWAGLVVPGVFVPATRAVETAPRRIEVTAKRFAFDPGDITLRKGEPVLLVLKSLDVSHGIRIKELGVEIKAPKGGTGQVQFTPDKVGDFVGHCFVFCGVGHGSMTITLHVIG